MSSRPLGVGSLSFIRLPDGRRVFAHWQRFQVDVGPGWSPELVHRFTLKLDGRELRLVDETTGRAMPYLSLSESYVEGRERLPIEAVAVGPDRCVARLSNYYSHHAGSVTSRITLAIDTGAMVARHTSSDKVDIGD